MTAKCGSPNPTMIENILVFQNTFVLGWGYGEPLIKDTVRIVLLLDFLELRIVLCEHQLGFIWNRFLFACNSLGIWNSE